MQKIAKREMIILGVMAAVVLVGAANLLLGGGAKRSAHSLPPALTSLTALTGDVAAVLSKGGLSVGEAYAIRRAEADWLRNPFYEKKAFRDMTKQKETAKTGAETKKNIVFSYTGYMELGGKQIAIINGLEYNAGEALETPGYVLKTISPEKIVIENNGDGEKINVPLQD